MNNIVRTIDKNFGILAFDGLLAGIAAILCALGTTNGIVMTAGILTAMLCVFWLVISNKVLAKDR